MIADEIAIEIFLFQPTNELLDVIDRRDIALSELNKVRNSSQSLFVKWCNSMRTIRAIDIIEMAAQEDNSDVIVKITTLLNSKAFRDKAIDILLQHRRDISYLNPSRIQLLQSNIDSYENMELKTPLCGIYGCEEDINIIAYYAALYGNKKVVDRMITLGVREYDGIMSGALLSGNIAIINKLIPLVTNYNKIAFYAAGKGYEEILFPLLNSVYNYHKIAYAAAEGGHKKILDKLIEKGVSDWKELAYYAAKGGHRELVDYFLNKCIRRIREVHVRISTISLLNYIAKGAIEGGHKDIVYAMIDGIKDRNGKIIRADRFSLIANHAANNGYKDVVEDMMRRDEYISFYHLDFKYHVDCKLYFKR